MYNTATYNRVDPSLFDVLAVDDTLPIDPIVMDYWLVNLKHPFRATIMHMCRFGATITLCTAYFLKRLLPFQFSAPVLLQGTINWFMKWFVTPEANVLILRHFWTESNAINFIIANTPNAKVEPVTLYPRTIDDLMQASFIDHDVVLFNALYDLGSIKDQPWPIAHDKLDFSTMREIEVEVDPKQKKWSQFLDFETGHELFKALFCILLKSDEYERSINSLQFDQTLALRIARITGDPLVAGLISNAFPLMLVGPLHLSYRFVMHGLFTEHLNAYLVQLRSEIAKSGSTASA
jgi:hypothetical protein